MDASLLSALLGVAVTMIVGEMALIGLLYRRNNDHKKGNPNGQFLAEDRAALRHIDTGLERAISRQSDILSEIRNINTILKERLPGRQDE